MEHGAGRRLYALGLCLFVVRLHLRAQRVDAGKGKRDERRERERENRQRENR